MKMNWPCAVLGKANLLQGKGRFAAILHIALHPASYLSCRVVVVQQVWGVKHLLPPSNLTLEVKEKLFIILGTQQPRHFPEFLGCFC